MPGEVFKAKLSKVVEEKATTFQHAFTFYDVLTSSTPNTGTQRPASPR